MVEDQSTKVGSENAQSTTRHQAKGSVQFDSEKVRTWVLPLMKRIYAGDYPTKAGRILGLSRSQLSELEVYRDLNGDGIPQTKTGSAENEVLYYIYSNMSQGYSMTPIQKTTVDSVPHYQWSFTYQNAYAYLQNANARVGVIARMLFEHLSLNYDFSVNGNV